MFLFDSEGLALIWLELYSNALRRWTSCWQQTPESNLEPLDPNGPLPFKSSALLSLAYVRNCYSVSKSRKIFSWEPSAIAESLQSSLTVDRKWSSLLSAYHATNFLATMVNIGVQYFKHNQAVLWSIEATLCGLESCVFLEKWLSHVQNTRQDSPLTGFIPFPFPSFVPILDKLNTHIF